MDIKLNEYIIKNVPKSKVNSKEVKEILEYIQKHRIENFDYKIYRETRDLLELLIP